MANPDDERTRRVDRFIEGGLEGRTRSAAEAPSPEFEGTVHTAHDELRGYGTPYRLRKEGGRYVTIKVDNSY